MGGGGWGVGGSDNLACHAGYNLDLDLGWVSPGVAFYIVFLPHTLVIMGYFLLFLVIPRAEIHGFASICR